jgi:hypothetical protein
MAGGPNGRLAQLEGSRDAGWVDLFAQSLIMMPNAAIKGLPIDFRAYHKP